MLVMLIVDDGSVFVAVGSEQGIRVLWGNVAVEVAPRLDDGHEQRQPSQFDLMQWPNPLFNKAP